jgi:hypothetical protein
MTCLPQWRAPAFVGSDNYRSFHVGQVSRHD